MLANHNSRRFVHLGSRLNSSTLACTMYLELDAICSTWSNATDGSQSSASRAGRPGALPTFSIRAHASRSVAGVARGARGRAWRTTARGCRWRAGSQLRARTHTHTQNSLISFLSNLSCMHAWTGIFRNLVLDVLDLSSAGYEKFVWMLAYAAVAAALSDS